MNIHTDKAFDTLKGQDFSMALITHPSINIASSMMNGARLLNIPHMKFVVD
jgi:hypothetical protein